MKTSGSYLDCGTWGTKAIKEARVFAMWKWLRSSKDKKLHYIPKDIKIPTGRRLFSLHNQ